MHRCRGLLLCTTSVLHVSFPGLCEVTLGLLPIWYCSTRWIHINCSFPAGQFCNLSLCLWCCFRNSIRVWSRNVTGLQIDCENLCDITQGGRPFVRACHIYEQGARLSQERKWSFSPQLIFRSLEVLLVRSLGLRVAVRPHGSMLGRTQGACKYFAQPLPGFHNTPLSPTRVY